MQDCAPEAVDGKAQGNQQVQPGAVSENISAYSQHEKA